METDLVSPRVTVRAAPKRLSCSGDEHLARLIRRGNEAAFAALYERYYQRLYRYCRSMLHNDADAQDALQSTFAGAFSALSQGRRDAPMRPWLYRIAYNESVSVLRRRRPEVALTEAHETPGASTEELVAGRARLALLVSDLGELTEHQRGALVMRELSGLSHEEIGTVFDISVGAAKQTIFEARRSLAEFAEGRAMACDEVCRAVSDGNGRVLRGRKLRAHLRECGSCAAFAAAIGSRSRDLRAIAPPLSAVAAAGLLRRSLAAGSGHSAGGGGAAATGSGAATASTGAGSVTAGGAGTGAVGTSAVGTGSATVAAGAVTKAAGLAVVAKAAVGVAVVATAAAGLAGAVNHFDSSSSRGVATARALHQSGHNAGSAAPSTAPAGTGHPAATAAAAAGRTSARAAARHRGKDHRAVHAHGSAASANASAQAHGSYQGATKSQGAANGAAGAKSPGAYGDNSAANVHSSSNGQSAFGAAQSRQASSTQAANTHRSATPTASSHSTTSRSSPARRHASRSASSGAAGSSQPTHLAPAGSSAPEIPRRDSS